MNTNYPSTLLPIDHEENGRLYDSSVYNSYVSYPDYANASKRETFECNYWSNSNPTQNILTIPSTNNFLESHPHSSSDSLLPLSLNSSTSTAIPHQHLYSTPSGELWYNPTDYPSPCTTYRPYSSYPTNAFYDQNQWSTTTTPSVTMKFESPYSPSSSYLDSSHPHPDPKEDYSDYSTKSSSLTPIPPRNPTTGKTRTRDKYRIVYTDRQRHELEHEFAKSKYISIPRKAALSSVLALSERQIKIWFQNRRAKERKLNKRRQDGHSRALNHSTDVDSPSDADLESPHYYSNYV